MLSRLRGESEEPPLRGEHRDGIVPEKSNVDYHVCWLHVGLLFVHICMLHHRP